MINAKFKMTKQYDSTAQGSLVLPRKLTASYMFHILAMRFTSERGQPLYSGQNDLSQCVCYYLEVPLYAVCIHRKTVSDEWDEQRCNYERYRFLILNQFKRVGEQETLAAIDQAEMYMVPGRPSTRSGSRDKAK